MIKWTWLAFLFALAPQLESPVGTAESKPGRIEGAVVSDDGSPIPYAQVEIQAGNLLIGGKEVVLPSYASVADDAGRFVIDNINLWYLLGKRTLYLSAQRTGFLRVTDQGPFELSPGEIRKGVILVMTPQSVVSGRVLGVDGGPIHDAVITIQRRGYQDGVRQMIRVLSEDPHLTNDLGEFRIPNLAAGRYYVIAERQASANPRSGLFSAPTYYPESTDWQTAIPIDLQPGQELGGLQIRLREFTGITVTGKVKGVDGQSVRGVSVYAIPESVASGSRTNFAGILRNVQTRRDGSFEFQGLRSGTYVLEAISSSKSASAGRVSVNVADRNVPNVEIHLGRAASVRGMVELEGTDLDSLPRRVTVRLTNSSGLPHRDSPAVPLGPKGSLEIKNIAPGRYYLDVTSLPPNTYVSSVRLDGVAASHGLLDLASGDAKVEIALTTGTASVHGIAKNLLGDTMGRRAITLWSANPNPVVRHNRVTYFITGSDGTFEFRNLPPGTYFVALWEDANIDRDLIQAPDFLNLMTGEATRLVLQSGSDVEVQLRPVPSSRVRTVEDTLP